MKSSLLGYFGIAAILIVGIFVMSYVSPAKEVSTSIATKEGILTSFGNFNHFFLKTFNQSVEFISQRSAYDLGKDGGFSQKDIYWSYYYPSMTVLTRNLNEKIENTFPSSYVKGERTVTLDGADTNVNPQQPLEGSTFFIAGGEANFSIYDESIRTRTFLNHKIDSTVHSSYFKLLNAGRAIFEESTFNSTLNDVNNLLNKLNNDPRFSDLSFDIRPISSTPVNQAFHDMGDVNWDAIIDTFDTVRIAIAFGSTPVDANWNPEADLNYDNVIDMDDMNIVQNNYGNIFPLVEIFEMTIKDLCYPFETYCLAPLNAGETGEIPGIPYDFIKLKFKFKTGQASFTPTSDFGIQINPALDFAESGDTNFPVVNVRNLGSLGKIVHLSSTIVDSSGLSDQTGNDFNITVSFGTNDEETSFNSIMRVETSSVTLPDIYNITITGNDSTLIRTATYSLTVNPSMVFIIDVSPVDGEVDVGDSNQTFVNVVKIGGTSRIIDLFIDNINPNPLGTISVDFVPDLMQPDFISTMTVRTNAGTSQGTYTLTIKGVGGGSFATDTYTLKVKRNFDFTIIINPPIETYQNLVGLSKPLTIHKTDGIAEMVTMSYSILNSSHLPRGDNFGISIIFPNSPCSPNNLLNECYPGITISTTASTPIDDYDVTLYGTSASGLVRTTLFTLKVKLAECNDMFLAQSAECNALKGLPEDGLGIPYYCKYWKCVNYQCQLNDHPDSYDPEGQCGSDTCADYCGKDPADGKFKEHSGALNYDCNKTCFSGICSSSCFPESCTYSSNNVCAYECDEFLVAYCGNAFKWISPGICQAESQHIGYVDYDSSSGSCGSLLPTCIGTNSMNVVLDDSYAQGCSERLYLDGNTPDRTVSAIKISYTSPSEGTHAFIWNSASSDGYSYIYECGHPYWDRDDPIWSCFGLYGHCEKYGVFTDDTLSFRKAWCDNEDTNCLLCSWYDDTIDYDGFGALVTTAWYVCKATDPLGILPVVGIIAVGVGTEIDGGDWGKWNCTSSGDWIAI